MTKRQFNEEYYNKYLRGKTIKRTNMIGEVKDYKTYGASRDFKSVEFSHMYTPSPNRWNNNPRPYKRYVRLYVCNIVQEVKQKRTILPTLKKKLHNLN